MLITWRLWWLPPGCGALHLSPEGSLLPSGPLWGPLGPPPSLLWARNRYTHLIYRRSPYNSWRLLNSHRYLFQYAAKVMFARHGSSRHVRLHFVLGRAPWNRHHLFSRSCTKQKPAYRQFNIGTKPQDLSKLLSTTRLKTGRSFPLSTKPRTTPQGPMSNHPHC